MKIMTIIGTALRLSVSDSEDPFDFLRLENTALFPDLFVLGYRWK
jgi:hypothetical protein